VPKRRSSGDEKVDLFSFMSILACLIGILTLMISVMMQAQQAEQEEKAGKTKEERARAMENLELKKKIEIAEKENEQKEELIKKEKKSVAALQHLKDRAIKLSLKLDDLKKADDPDQSDTALQKLIENMIKEIAALKEEQPPLDKRLKELQAELKSRKEAPKPKESVKIRPRGFGEKGARNLFFVECNSTGVVLYTKGVPGKPISTKAIPTNEIFNDYLEKVKKTHDSMVLFLVRKSGKLAYDWAAGIAETKYRVSHGKLPMPNDGKIDLSAFK
jgi:hypothetical protein